MSRKELSATDLIALGKRSILPENKFGANIDIANAATEDIWGSATAFVPLSSNTAMEAISTSITDSDTGGVNPQSTGARTVRVYGIKADWTLAQEDVILDGTTAVALASTYMGIYRMVVLTAGSNAKNAGVLKVRVASAGAEQCHVQIGYNQSTHGIYPIPAGYTALIDQINISTDASSGINAKMYTLESQNTNLKTIKKNFQASGVPIKTLYVVPEKTWIIWEATNGSGGTAFVSVEFDMRLVPTSMIRSY